VIGGSLIGTINVGGTLQSLRVGGGTPGVITAGRVGSIGAGHATGPLVAQIVENGMVRRVEMAVPSTPYPSAATAPTPTGVTLQYLYESAGLANPQLTARLTNASGSTAPDQLDLSLVVYNDAAKFNLARLDAGGVSGLRNVAVEGDILTGISPAASAFFVLPNGSQDPSPAGVYLPQDRLAGVAVRDYVPNGSIAATSIQSVSFGSHTQANGAVATGALAAGADAQRLLAPGTAIIPAGSVNGPGNETFRVPFADLSTQQVGFFMDDTPGSSSFGNKSVVLVVQSVLTPNSSGTANVATPSNVARGAVTALITVAESVSSSGTLQPSVIQAVSLRGDGGSIQTQQPITQSITSTGPLGDLLLQGTLTANVTAPSIFGSIIPQGGPIAGTIQTTGIRTDPITAQTSQVPADLGRVYVTTTNKGPVLTSTIVHAFGTGLSGQIISRGNLISQVIADSGISGVIAVQGNVGTTFTYPGGQVVRINSGSSESILSNSNIPFTGQLVVLGNIIGDVTLNGGMQSGRIAVQDSILGNLTINGVLDSQSILVAGGSIGSATYGTGLTAGTIQGIVAAVGPINVVKISSNQALYYQANDTPDAAVIDAIFSQDVSPLSPTDLFDRTTPEDLVNLSQMRTNLRSLSVKNGKLYLPPP
jgi:hypothetical protein